LASSTALPRQQTLMSVLVSSIPRVVAAAAASAVSGSRLS
jgi:hypothetical protein